jgi:hypothetical protein
MSSPSLASNVSVCKVVNKIDSARDTAHATRLSEKMFRSINFFAGGTASLKGDHRVRILTPLFLDGLGDLWSASYMAMEVTHTVSNAGYHTEAQVYSNSLVGGEPGGQFANDTSQSPNGQTDTNNQVYLTRDSGGVKVTNQPAGN